VPVAASRTYLRLQLPQIMKILILSLSLIVVISFSYAQEKYKKDVHPNYLSFRGLFPISLLERESIFSMGLQLKYYRIGIEVEYGRILGLNSYRQAGPIFEDKTSGSRTRVNLKYYFYSLPFQDKVDFHFYTSIMPSIKSVKYKMIWWSYDSLISNNTYQMAQSDIAVNYSSKSLCINLLFGNEFFISLVNIDYYIGVGIKFYDINIPNSVPSYFEPFSRPQKDGTYFNYLLGAKVGFARRIKRK
jgi:hypothetical protein